VKNSTVAAGAPIALTRTRLTRNQKRGFLAAWGGWALDGMDASIYALVLVPALTDLLPRWIDFSHINPLYSAIVGGALSGLGILFFIRHRASLGGIGILAVYLQRTRGWSAGKVQMSYDACLMVAAFFVLSPSKVLYSAIGAVVLSLVLMFNHRPGRYMGV